MEKHNPTLQYVVVDLTKEKWNIYSLSPSIHATFLGGNGLGLYLYDSYCSAQDENCELTPLIFTTGLFTQFQIIDKDSLTITGTSLLTKKVTSATCHTSFASHLISCGLCALVVIGSARRPMILDIEAQEILFKPTEKLFNKKVSESVDHLNLSNKQSCIVIGPAGENRVPFASLISGGKSLEREGFGALMGAKSIKAIIIKKGPYTFKPSYPKEIGEITKKIDATIKNSLYYKTQEKENHLHVVKNAHEGAFAGVAHSTKRSDPRLVHLYGSSNPHLYSHPSQNQIGSVFITDTYGNKVLMDGSTMLGFGSNIKNYDPILSATYTHLSIDLGLDPISTAMTISWIMEGVERGVVDDIPISYTDLSHLEEIIESIAFNSHGGKRIAKGSSFLAKEYKDESFVTAIHNKEMMPFDPRGAYGQALLMALGYDILHPQETLYTSSRLTEIKGKALSVLLCEQVYLLSCALGISYQNIVSLLYNFSLCRHLAGPIHKNRVELLEHIVTYLLGNEVNDINLFHVARQTLELEERINGRSRSEKATLPLQFLLDGSSNYEKENTVPLTKLLDEYKVLLEVEKARIQ